MRPLNLSIKGFTAFRDEQQIDFTDLDLFSLWGPTGSGKSSVLDAITFALYGKVERVEGTKEEKLTALITHGQPRMAVTLDFRAGDNSYRITRTNSLNGSKVRLERREGEDFVSYGEGADSVTEVSKIVPHLIGLDYNAFTRSVVLPQGKFAEFLVGDAKKRRDILTELLGLEMFGRMAQRSNEISRDAKSALQAKEGVLASEYAGIDDEATERAALIAKELEAEVKAATEAESLLEDLAEEFEEQNRKAKALIELGRDVDDLRTSFEDHAEALEGHGRELEKTSATARKVRKELEVCDKEHGRLAKERARVEEAHGTLEDLADLRAQVLSLRNLERDAEKAKKTVTEQDRIQAAAEKALKEQDAIVKKAETSYERAQAELEKRENEHDLATRHDLVGALTHDLKRGDACPVCERPLLKVPDSDPADLKAAQESQAKAAAEVKRTQGAASAAHVAQARAAQAVEEAQRRASECAAEAKDKVRQVEEAHEHLAAMFKEGAKKDLLEEVEGRQEGLRDLVDAEKKAVESLAKATSEDARSQEALSTLKTEAATIKGAIESAPLKALVDRATAAIGKPVKIKLPAKLPAGAAELATRAASLGEELGDLRSSIDEEAASLIEQEEALIQKARNALPAEFEDEIEGADVKQLLAGARKVCRDLSQRAALAAKDSTTIKSKLEKRRVLEGEVQEHKKEQSIFTTLGQELKNDRIVQFLQAEALAVLAATAGEHLKELSDGRYRLAYQDDRFYVIDGWNGDEKRSVRTLSGGETFLASLGLALALSEQVQLLAVTERARLESLFLDEGFGSLDAETLDIVVSAISRLGSDGRLVGVITHVAEVADSMPVRIQVIKGPRGSKIQMPGDAGTITLDDASEATLV